MKALILSGGSGTRLRPLTFGRSKQLLPVANRPLLDHVLSNIAKAGVEQTIVVTGANGAEIRDYVGDGSEWGLTVTYAFQPEPLGLAHAVTVAADALADEPFLMYLGDNILPDGIAEYLRAFQEEGPDALVLLHPVADPRSFGIAVLEGRRVVRLVEKPSRPPSNLGLVGVYFFSPEIHASIRRIKPSSRGELEITDAIQDLLERQRRVEARIVDGPWHDAGNPEELLKANRTLLTRVLPDCRGETDEATKMRGAVEIGEGTVILRSEITGPASIGRNCRIADSRIGPWASVGDGCAISESSVTDSILLTGCKISKTPAIVKSIFGAETELSARGSVVGNICALTGDQCRIWIVNP